MSDAQKFIADFAAQLAAKSPESRSGTPRPAAGSPASGAAEERVVIRPAGAAPTGVRVSPTLANPPAVINKPPPRTAAASRPAAKGKAKGKPRKPVSTRPSLLARLRGGMRDFRFRLLPLTIFVAVLMLGVRVGDLWRIAARDAKLPDFPVTLAQGPQMLAQAPAQSPASTPPAPAATTRPAAPKPVPQQTASTPPKDAPPAQGGMSGAPAPVAGAAPLTPLVPLGPIDNQELLQHFAERRAEIERRTKEMEQREALLAAAEKRIDQKVAEMEKVRTDIQKLMNQGDEKQSAQLESLVKIYETMKPKEAARIFEEMDMPVLLGVIQKMKEQKTAPILAAMDPVKAKEVTSALIERRVPMKAN
ncbi:MotE family protein [Azospirillum doebereinerae]